MRARAILSLPPQPPTATTALVGPTTRRTRVSCLNELPRLTWQLNQVGDHRVIGAATRRICVDLTTFVENFDAICLEIGRKGSRLRER